MAHKHNRRRVRPRSRNNNQLSFSSSSYASSPSLGYASMTSSDDAMPPVTNYPARQPRPPQYPFPSQGLATKQPHTWSVVWQNRDQAQRREGAKLEAEQIQLFGGEPGDDVDLCYKMLEVFGGMGWIDT